MQTTSACMYGLHTFHTVYFECLLVFKARRQKNGCFTVRLTILFDYEGSQKCIFLVFDASAKPKFDDFVTEQQTVRKNWGY